MTCTIAASSSAHSGVEVNSNQNLQRVVHELLRQVQRLQSRNEVERPIGEAADYNAPLFICFQKSANKKNLQNRKL